MSPIVHPAISPPVNLTFEPVILPAAETLKLLDDINETGSAKFCEEEISYKLPADKLELPNVVLL